MFDVSLTAFHHHGLIGRRFVWAGSVKVALSHHKTPGTCGKHRKGKCSPIFTCFTFSTEMRITSL